MANFLKLNVNYNDLCKQIIENKKNNADYLNKDTALLHKAELACKFIIVSAAIWI